MKSDKPIVTPTPWTALRRYTPARIALGRSGISLPTAPHLAFQLAHAQARDAVHRSFDVEATAAAVEALGLSTLRAQSAAADRHTYLQRPDLGRRLDQASAAELQARREPGRRFDLGLILVDGLSALAIETNAAGFLAALLPLLQRSPTTWSLSPAVLVQQGRVAVGDEIGALLDASLVLVLIGERPGLSSPDSMGLYLTWSPRVGCNDAQRNCISNVRAEGLTWPNAAIRAAYLLEEARGRKLTGVDLKDESVPVAQVRSASPNFLLAG
jgi:ethanolamine ammonia-lyase small subunit